LCLLWLISSSIRPHNERLHVALPQFQRDSLRRLHVRFADANPVDRPLCEEGLNGYAGVLLLKPASQVFGGTLILERSNLNLERGAWNGRLIEHFQLHGHDAGTDQVNLTGGAQGKIDNPAVDEGTAIVDPDIHFAPVARVRHANERVERQSAMCGGQCLIGVEDFAAGRFPAVIRLGIIGRETFQIVGGNGRRGDRDFDLNLLMPAPIEKNDRAYDKRQPAHPNLITQVTPWRVVGHYASDMVLALLTSALISIICFVVTLFMGFTMTARTALAQHVLIGLFTTFLVTLTQSMTMFYFIGTGKQVKDLARGLPSGARLVQRTKIFKAKVFPPALWAMLFTMATMIIGGGVHTRVAWTPPLLHALLAGVSLYFNIVAFWKIGRAHV